MPHYSSSGGWLLGHCERERRERLEMRLLAWREAPLTLSTSVNDCGVVSRVGEEEGGDREGKKGRLDGWRTDLQPALTEPVTSCGPAPLQCSSL